MRAWLKRRRIRRLREQLVRQRARAELLQKTVQLYCDSYYADRYIRAFEEIAVLTYRLRQEGVEIV